MPDPIYDVFLSYASRDRAAAEALARRLKAEGLKPFFDVWDLIPGEARQEGLEAALENSRTLAAFVGNGEICPWQNEEIRDALDTRTKDKGYRVIPVLLPGAAQPEDDALPRFLRRLTWVKFRHDLEDKGALHRLVSGIRGLAPGPLPAYPNLETQGLAEELDQARATLRELGERDEDTTKIRARILDLRRRIREGGLKAGDALADGRYKLIRELGSGGFAQVWRAWDRSRERHVAAKVLHLQYSNNSTRLERFRRGARQMAELQHPNIVKVLDRDLVDGGFHFFVMECLATDFRRAVLEDELDLEQRWSVILNVGRALQHAHEHGVIHRDVKPANILLAANGVPKLTDFDLVCAAETTGGTRTGAMGSFVYAAPEMLHHPQCATRSVDIYSLGMTAVFGLNGKELPPRVFRDAGQFLGEKKSLRMIRRVLARAVEWEKEGRWLSVRAFCEALETATKKNKLFLSAPATLGPAPASLDDARQIISEGGRLEKSGGAVSARLLEKLVGVMQCSALPAQERHLAGNLVSDLGHLPRDLDTFVFLPEEWFGYPFGIARYPVTNAQYRRFVEDGGGKPDSWNNCNRNRDLQPVVGVSWCAASEYCKWLSEQLRMAGEIDRGQHVRLPTFAEWRKVAGWTTGRSFPWGHKDIPRSSREANGVKVASPVNMHPDSATPEGVWGLWVTVPEWTSTERDSRFYLVGGGSSRDRGEIFENPSFAKADLKWGLIGFRVSISPLAV